MNSAIKAAIFNPQSHLCNLRSALFHSTPVLERRRRSYSHTPPRPRHHSSSYAKRFHRAQSKKSLLHDMNAFADHLFQNWQEKIDDDGPSSSRGTSWFKKDYGRSKNSQNQGRQDTRRSTWINEEVDDDEDFVDIDRVFETIFGRRQGTRFSFTYKHSTRRSSSYGYNYWDNQHSWAHRNWRSRVEEEHEFEEESEDSELDMASYRRALGLSASGPLKHEDVKIAYRACALKWHPDRHQGSSKAVAEEKFKLCSAAYQTLCDKLAMN